MKPVVYVMKTDLGLVKVGISKDAKKRARGLSNASGLAVSVERTFDTKSASAVERVAHKLLAEHRRKGEWFDVSINEAVSAIQQAVEIVESGRFRDPSPSGCVTIAFKVSQAWLDKVDGWIDCQPIPVSRSDLIRAAVERYIASHSVGRAA